MTAAGTADELPRVTASLLRRADTMCRRRLAHEHESGRKLSPVGDAPFEVSNRVTADAITWHRGAVAPEHGAAVADLAVEGQYFPPHVVPSLVTALGTRRENRAHPRIQAIGTDEQVRAFVVAIGVVNGDAITVFGVIDEFLAGSQVVLTDGGSE